MKNTNTVHNEIHYTQVGDYQLPLLTLSQTDEAEPLDKYSRMRLAYLKNQRPVLYNQMLLNGTLWPHLQDVQRAASEQLERTIAALADKFPAPDKERAQLSWVAHMNGLKAQAEEMVLREIVYAE
ncbi:MAG: TnpV protein [Faecalibacterium prausnitzii]